MPRTLVIFAIRVTSRFSTRMSQRRQEVSYPVILQSMVSHTYNSAKADFPLFKVETAF
jgi:hypothetical protein